MDVTLDRGVIVVRYDGRPGDDVFEAYLRRYESLAGRGEPYATVYATASGARIPQPHHARLQAAWMKQHQPMLRDWCRGLGFSLSTPLMRGVLRAVLKMQPLAAEHAVFSTEDEAIAWARARLDLAA